MDKESQPPVVLDEGRYTTHDAASFLGFTPGTLNTSRCTGKLAGISPPAFFKIGSKVFYGGKTLREWRDQFIEHVKTPKAA